MVSLPHMITEIPTPLLTVGITPGKNMGFEAAPFKLTQEMLDIMGGGVDAEHFASFQVRLLFYERIIFSCDRQSSIQAVASN